MSTTNGTPKRVPSRLFPTNTTTNPPSLSAFKSLCTTNTTDPTLYPLSSSISKNIPIYDIPDLTTRGVLSSEEDTDASETLQDEFHHILTSGPGILVLRGLYTDKQLLHNVNDTFQSIITREENAPGTDNNPNTATNQNAPFNNKPPPPKKKGDHFSPPGTNSRIWNSFTKHALHSPPSFLPYYSNPYLSLLSSAYLGPHYRITAQVNIVKPGGPPQSPHRDYHLGFQSAESISKFPRNIQLASSLLTLQGAVAHSDMPAESGPTRFLPFSHHFEQGFIAYHRPEFKSFFEETYVALPLQMGDGVFFNPAVFHAAGGNVMSPARTAIERKANLLQISCGFGKAMESVDSIPIVERCWDLLREKAGKEDGGNGLEVECFVKAVGDGYPFPTNLDRRAPGEGGMAPESEQDLLFKGLKEGWGVEKVVGELKRMREEGMAVCET